VLFATYLYTKPDRAPSQAPMRFADLEKTVSPAAVPHGDPFGSLGKSPNGVSDAIPVTPTKDANFQSKRDA
jgi:hypothetical protein